MATVVENDLLKDAALIVDVCFSVEEGDVVTIICDDEPRGRGRARSRRSCVERGGWPVIMNNEKQVRRGRADVRFPMAPPANLHRAMVGSDEVIIIANLEWANRFAHVNAVRETCEANGKIASIEPGMGAWGLTREDLERSAQRTKDAVAALAGKKQCRVTTRARHRLHRLDRGPTAARADAVQGARPDDEPGAALDGGRVRGGRGLHARHRRRRRRHARHRPRGAGEGADPLDDRGRQAA